MYLFIWSGRFQISTINSRTSFFQVEGSNVGHGLVFKFCNYLIIVFLCNFCYFRFRLFISFFLGAFNIVQSNQGFICFRNRLRVSSCSKFCFYYLNILQPPKPIQFFRLLSINVDVLSNFLLVDSSFYLLVDSGKLLVDLRFTTRN